MISLASPSTLLKLFIWTQKSLSLWCWMVHHPYRSRARDETHKITKRLATIVGILHNHTILNQNASRCQGTYQILRNAVKYLCCEYHLNMSNIYANFKASNSSMAFINGIDHICMLYRVLLTLVVGGCTQCWGSTPRECHTMMKHHRLMYNRRWSFCTTYKLTWL